MSADTIAAIATPFGKSGIGVIRISGGAAHIVADKLFKAYNKNVSPLTLKGYTSALGRIYDGENPVDEAVIQIFRAPKSYTGENVAEISCHGGIWILQQVLRLCYENGAVPAEPGEFTKRAFLNGKLDLTEAEAVMDLIDGNSQSAVRAAMAARDGAISTSVRKIVENLLGQSAQLAAWADFPDEDLVPLDTDTMRAVLNRCVDGIDELLSTYDNGRVIRDGISTAIVGKPNVGKSTLMNLLAGDERSIVTDIPGTTRDVIEDSIRLGDFVLKLADTAGIRDTDDPIERAGVLRSQSRIETADLILAVFDSSDTLDDNDFLLLKNLEPKRCIAIINKIDLPKKIDVDAIRRGISDVVMFSAKDGNGRDKLEKAVKRVLGLSDFDPAAAVVATERQRLCLAHAKESVLEALYALDNSMLDAANVCIDYALENLFILTGEKVSDKVINEVFSKFCVGK